MPCDAAVTGNQIQRRSQKRPIVFVGLRIEQVDARDIAFAALGGIQSGGAADGEKLRAHALLLQFAKQVIETDAVAADHDEIGQLQIAAEQLDLDDAFRPRRSPRAGRSSRSRRRG